MNYKAEYVFHILSLFSIVHSFCVRGYEKFCLVFGEPFKINQGTNVAQNYSNMSIVFLVFATNIFTLNYISKPKKLFFKFISILAWKYVERHVSHPFLWAFTDITHSGRQNWASFKRTMTSHLTCPFGLSSIADEKSREIRIG